MQDIVLNESQKYRRDLILKGLQGMYTNAQLSFELMLSVRRIQELKAKSKIIGDKAFIHGNTGRKPAITIPDYKKEKILKIHQTTNKSGYKIFSSVNYTHFTDLLKKNYKIEISRTTLTKILNDIGYKSPKTRRNKNDAIVHLCRERRKKFGELIQADGTEYDWFNNGKKYVIQGFLDDATGKPVGLFMTKHECLFGYIEATRFMIKNYGIPEQLYPDRLGVFFVNKKEPTIEQQLTGKKPLTQFGRMMEELGVDMFPAHSPEAKGRIERFWGTIQSRLPVEFALRNITTVEEANNFLPKFMNSYSKTFGVKPASAESAFVSLSDVSILSQLLAVKVERCTDNSGVISLHNYKFMIPTCLKQKVILVMSHNEGIYAVNKNGRKHKIFLIEQNNVKTHMPEVQKNLFQEFFMKNAKGRYKEFFLETS